MPIYNYGPHVANPPGTTQPQLFPGGLQLAGPVVPIQIEIPSALAAQLQRVGTAIPAPVPGIGLVDTGASVSAVDKGIVQQLGIQPIGVANVGTAGGQQQQAVFPAKFSFPGTNLPTIEFNQLLGSDLAGQTIPGPLPGQLVALLGRDILQHFVLIYNGPFGSFSLAY